VSSASLSGAHLLRCTVGAAVGAELEGECVLGSSGRDHKEAAYEQHYAILGAQPLRD
jgi:hypothetical protein